LSSFYAGLSAAQMKMGTDLLSGHCQDENLRLVLATILLLVSIFYSIMNLIELNRALSLFS